MERNIYNNSFEELLKERSDEFRMYPSKRVWHSIYNDLHPGHRWPSFAAAILFIFSLTMLGYWNTKSSDLLHAKAVAELSPKNELISDKNIKQHEGNLPENLISINNTKKPYILADNLTELSKNKIAKKTLDNHDKEVNNSNIAALFAPIQNPRKDLDNLNNNSFLVSSIHDNLLAKYEESSLPKNETFKPGNSNTNNLIANRIKTKPQEIPLIAFNEIENNNNIDEANQTKNKAVNKASDSGAAALTADEKAWIEAYALHNKSKRKKWKDRTTLEFYVTPSVDYRSLTSEAKYYINTTIPAISSTTLDANVNQMVNQKNGFGLEAGFNFNYTFAKRFRLIAGVQGNFTSYAIMADNVNHPVTTNLLLINEQTGAANLKSFSSSLYNSTNIQPVAVHNKTYQISLPVGIAYKLHSFKNVDWYAASTIQPTYVFGGTAYLISADRKNYVRDASFIRQFNLNLGAETYINYKFDNYSLQIGPQFRYQIYSTYNKNYTVNENLYNLGIKIGIVKSF